MCAILCHRGLHINVNNNNNNNIVTLLIKDPQPSDAGGYECFLWNLMSQGLLC